MPIRYLILPLLALVLAACGPTASPPTISPTDAATPARPTALPQPTEAATQPKPTPTQSAQAEATIPPAPMNDLVITYNKSGGFAGVNETLVIKGNGALEYRNRKGDTRQIQAAPADVSQLGQLVTSPEFDQLESRYQITGADMFVYEITVSSGGKEKKVQTMDGVQNPPILDQAIKQLETLRRQAAQ